MEWLGHHLGDHVRRGQIPLGTARLHAIVDGVEVGADVIRIVGAEGSRETTLAGTTVRGVRKSARKWRALRQGNPNIR